MASSATADVLRQLGVADTVAEYASLGDHEQFRTDLINLPEKEIHGLTKQECTDLLAAALVRGLELYVSSSKRSSTASLGTHPTQLQHDQSSSSSSAIQSQFNLVLRGQADLLPTLTRVLMTTNYKLVVGHANATTTEVIARAARLLASGLLPLLPEAWSCLAVQAAHQKQLLTQQLKKQHSKTAMQKAAQPLAQLHLVCSSLLDVWSTCISFSTSQLQCKEAESIAARFEAALVSVQHVCCAATATAAVWQCEQIMQQCLTPVEIKSRQVNLRACWTAANMTAWAFRRLAAASDGASVAAAAGCHDLLWVLIVRITLDAAYLHEMQQGRSPALISMSPSKRSSSSTTTSSSSLLSSSQLTDSSSSSLLSSSQPTDSSSSSSSSRHAAAAHRWGEQAHGAAQLTVPAHHVPLLQAVEPISMLRGLRVVGSTSTSKRAQAELQNAIVAAIGCLCKWHEQRLNLHSPAVRRDPFSSTCSSNGTVPAGQLLPGSGGSSGGSSSGTDPGSSSGGGGSRRSGTGKGSKSNCTSSGSMAPAHASIQLMPMFAHVLAEVAALRPEPWLLQACIRVLPLCSVVGFYMAGVDIAQVLHAARSQPISQAVTVAEQRRHLDVGQYHILQLLVPVHQHLAAQGSATAAADGSDLFELLAEAMMDVMRPPGSQSGARVSDASDTKAAECALLAADVLPCDVMPPSLVLSSLEAVVRHGWAAQPNYERWGVLAAVYTVAAASATTMPQLLEYAADVSKAPVLLSLLLSCVKRLQHCSRYMGAAANCHLAATAMSAAQLALRLSELSCSRKSSSGSSNKNTATTTSSSSSSSRRETGSTRRSSDKGGQLVSSSSSSSNPAHFSGQGPAGGTASCWVLLLGRSLYAAGWALQTAAGPTVIAATAASTATAAGVDGNPEENPTLAQQLPAWCSSLLPMPCPSDFLATMHSELLQLSSTLNELSAPAAGQAAAGGVHGKQLQPILHVPAVKQPVQEAYSSLLEALTAAAATACDLEAAAAAAAAATADGASASLRADSKEGREQLWQQLLNHQAGSQLTSDLLGFGSLLCGSLPSRYCCNEPSCCCFDRPSELQLASGKGSQCSGCGAARYCGAEDQRRHWQSHKAACSALAAAGKSSKKQVQL